MYNVHCILYNMPCAVYAYSILHTAQRTLHSALLQQNYDNQKVAMCEHNHLDSHLYISIYSVSRANNLDFLRL